MHTQFAPMSQHIHNKTEQTGILRTTCAVVFMMLSFCWLYFFQGDILTVVQHGLSGGKTHYDHAVGAVIITAVAQVLQLLVYAFIRLSHRSHALTYLPSFLLLAFISSVSFPFSWGAWPWATPMVLILWGLAIWVAKKVPPFINDVRGNKGLFSRPVWLNLLQITAMMFIVTALSNTNAVDHFKAHAEVSLGRGDTAEALRAGKKSHETDASLTMLRAFALSQQGELGNRFFEYAVVGSSSDLLPLAGSNSSLQLLADTLLWDHFGVRPDSIVNFGSQVLTTAQYIDSLMCDTLATSAWHDYVLTGQLMDRNLDSFVVSLPRYYVTDADSLPRHYREALVLYRQRIDTLFIYSDSVMDNVWHSYASYDSIYPVESERKIRTESDFPGTYWLYYDK